MFEKRAHFILALLIIIMPILAGGFYTKLLIFQFAKNQSENDGAVSEKKNTVGGTQEADFLRRVSVGDASFALPETHIAVREEFIGEGYPADTRAPETLRIVKRLSDGSYQETGMKISFLPLLPSEKPSDWLNFREGEFFEKQERIFGGVTWVKVIDRGLFDYVIYRTLDKSFGYQIEGREAFDGEGVGKAILESFQIGN